MLSINNTFVIIGAFIVVSVIAGVTYQKAKAPTQEQVIEEQISKASTTPSVTLVPASSAKKFPLNTKDTITSWFFKGSYIGNDVLVAQATTNIAHLTGLLDKEGSNDYDLYVGIGNNYTYLGDGAVAFENYNKAIAQNSGDPLVYMNLGSLMDKLGAYYTAADAYAKAVELGSSFAQYRNAQMDFLTERFPEEAEKLRANQ